MPASRRAAASRPGLLIAEICMGGLGQVRLRAGGREGWPTWLEVRSSQPVLACLASQYAGWSLAASKEETGGKKFFSLGSGPARALAGKEPLFAELGYRDRADARRAGAGGRPARRPQVVIDKVLRDCGLAPEGLTLVLTPTDQPRRHDPGRRARARGRAAQGARARLRARRHRRRRRAPRRCPRRARTASRRWAAPTTRSCTAAACT